ncbi:hypothetical protein FRC12_008486 [Ceratobasidium sp. 428]|nr:hypothetical protein FRC12_008486 [Ceratobasidium sp. 428]
MFASTVQPPAASLFSSVGSDPLRLFATSTDPTLPSDSIIHLLNDQISLPHPTGSDVQLIALPEVPDDEKLNQQSSLSCTVLHIQSPTIKTTYIRCPSDLGKSLGLTHPWFHMQFRDLGKEFSFEIGMTDTAGKDAVLRCSTFQDEPRVEHLNPALLHVPLDITPPNSSTPWRTLFINLPTILPYFSTASGQEYHPAFGRYAGVTYLKVYANCRLRRVWLTKTPDSGVGARNWEFGMYT